MTEQSDNTVTSTQFTDMDSTTLSAAVSDLNHISEKDEITPVIRGHLRIIADNLANMLPTQTMAHTRWNDKKHTLRQAIYVDPDTDETKEVIMLIYNKNRNYITFLDLNDHDIHHARPENLIPGRKQYTV